MQVAVKHNLQLYDPADILTAPNSIEQIGTILQRGTATPFADAAVRQALQSRGAEAAGQR